MKAAFRRIVCLAFLCSQAMTLDAAPADPPLVFISAFAAGETGAIHVLQWDGASGSLKPLRRTTGMANPFSDGKWLLCANMPANNVVVFRIDSPTGGLKPVGDPVALPMPACIRFVP